MYVSCLKPYSHYQCFTSVNHNHLPCKESARPELSSPHTIPLRKVQVHRFRDPCGLYTLVMKIKHRRLPLHLSYSLILFFQKSQTFRSLCPGVESPSSANYITGAQRRPWLSHSSIVPEMLQKRGYASYRALRYAFGRERWQARGYGTAIYVQCLVLLESGGR